MLNLKGINIGVKINTPYTLEKNGIMKHNIADSDTSMLTNLKGTDKLRTTYDLCNWNIF